MSYGDSYFGNMMNGTINMLENFLAYFTKKEILNNTIERQKQSAMILMDIEKDYKNNKYHDYSENYKLYNTTFEQQITQIEPKFNGVFCDCKSFQDVTKAFIKASYNNIEEQAKLLYQI